LRCWPPGGEYQEFEKEQKLQSVNAKTCNFSKSCGDF
jgi:hypothetical protein